MQGIPISEETIQSTKLPKPHIWKEISIFSQMIMELAWIVPWYRSLTQGTNLAQTWRAFVVFMTIMLSFYWLSKAMNFFNIRLSLRRVVLMALLLIVAFLGLRYLLYFSEPINMVDLLIKPIAAFANLFVLIPDEFVILLVIIFVAFRGVTIASQRTSPTDMLVRFQFGMVMIVFYILLNTLVTGEALGSIVFVYLFAGLIAMGTARMTVTERLRGGREIPFDRKWFFGLLISALVVILAAYLAAQFTNLPLFTIVIQLFTTIFSFIIGVILILLMPLFLLLLSGLMWLIDNVRLGDLLPDIAEDLQSALNNLANLTGQLLEYARNLLPDLSFARPYILLFGILLVIFLGMLFLGLSWLVRNYKRIELDDIESLIEAGDWLGLLQRFLQDNLKKIGRNLETGLGLNLRDRRRAAERIRQIYQDLVSTSGELGVERLEAETPYEFLPRLSGLFPEHQSEVEEITQAYIKIRYGEYPESMTEVEKIEQDWNVIQRVAKSRPADQQANRSFHPDQ